MNKVELKEQISASIDQYDVIGFLQELIQYPSEYGKPTTAQEIVIKHLRKMNFDIDQFSGNMENVTDLEDFCPLPENQEIGEDAYNVVGLKKGKSNQGKSLLLFSHIDTELNQNTLTNPLIPKVENGRVYGLGAADAKCGIAMMVLASQAVFANVEGLDGTLCLMSVLGKRGGSAGTLSAIMRGYTADAGIYLHPAETGHGFNEIKSYSMGMIDFKITVTGEVGVEADDIDDSEVSAILNGNKVITALIEFDLERRSRLIFEQGSFQGRPKTKLHIGKAYGGTYVGLDPLSFTMECRMVFGVGETISSVMQDLKVYLADYFVDDDYLNDNPPKIEWMFMRASPAYVPNDAPITKTITDNIKAVQPDVEFIFQHHGASDIRLPIIYGNTPSIGIGPLCGNIYAANKVEWVDIQDYIDGIKIVANIIVDWCLSD